MKIIMGPTEIAGQIGTLCNQLQRKGYIVGGFNWFHTYLNYNRNIINTDYFEVNKELPIFIKNMDIFHFHNGETFMQGFADLPLIKEAEKKLIMHHWGSDVRQEQLTKELNPYPLPPSYFSDEEIHERLTKIANFIDTAIIQDYELLPYVKDYYKNIHILPLAIDMNQFKPAYPEINNNEPLIIHAPTNREFKGSSYIEAAIEKLQNNKKFTYKVIEKKSHKEATEMYMESDIIIDQILCGTYGMLAVEAMAMGKVVVGFIRDDIREQLPYELPIVNATPETIFDVLSDLIDHPEKRNEIGRKSREYVANYHASEKVIKKLISIYNEL